jgi:HK97 family phage major capsid protein
MGRIQGFRNIPFNTRMPRQTSGSTVGWVGQGAPKPVTKLQFDTVTVPHAKIAAIVAITDELARMSTPSAEATVRQDLLEAIAQFMDVQFIDQTIAASADVSPGAITNGITGVDSTGGTVAQVTTDLNLALTSLATANIAMRNPYWVMHTRSFNYLRTLRTAQDIFAFRDELNAGRLMGYPVVVSNNVPLRDQNAGGGTEGYITLFDASEIFMADDGETMLDVSREASLQMDSAPSAGAQALVSLWQNNLVGIRAERYVYWQRRRDAAVYQIDMVTY